jgi:hypothetical protein
VDRDTIVKPRVGDRVLSLSLEPIGRVSEVLDHHFRVNGTDGCFFLMLEAFYRREGSGDSILVCNSTGLSRYRVGEARPGDNHH